MKEKKTKKERRYEERQRGEMKEFFFFEKSLKSMDPHSGTYCFFPSVPELSFRSQAVQADLLAVSFLVSHSRWTVKSVGAMAIFVDSVVHQEGILDREGKPSRL